jgi:hypothetical protein
MFCNGLTTARGFMNPGNEPGFAGKSKIAADVV